MSTPFQNSPVGAELIQLGLLSADGQLTGASSGSGVSVVAVDPVAPANGDVWILAEGVSPAASLTLKVRIGGTTVAVPLVSY